MNLGEKFPAEDRGEMHRPAASKCMSKRCTGGRIEIISHCITTLTWVIFTISCLTFAAPVKAGFEEGQEAFRTGDYETAISEWQVSAEQGHAGSQFYLGVLHYKAIGVEEDLVKAKEYFSTAYENGHAQAAFALGYMYHSGKGGEVSLDQAFKLFTFASDGGNAAAKFALSMMYSDGTGTDVDLEKGKALLTESARAEFPTAIVRLGENLIEGTDGFEKDIDAGKAWLCKGGEIGSATYFVKYGSELSCN